MSNIKCGNCDGRHESADQVRNCYATVNRTPGFVAGSGTSRDPFYAKSTNGGIVRPTRSQAVTGVRPATDAQQSFIADLRRQRGLDAERFAGNTREASAEITRLKALPKAKQAEDFRAFPEVDSGRYAVEVSGVLKFYKVSVRDYNGRKMTFVDVQASDELHAVTNFKARTDILRAIALDPRAALTRYGMELGSCGHCGRTLTDAESRARGIGPICITKLGW